MLDQLFSFRYNAKVAAAGIAASWSIRTYCTTSWPEINELIIHCLHEPITSCNSTSRSRPWLPNYTILYIIMWNVAGANEPLSREGAHTQTHMLQLRNRQYLMDQIIAAAAAATRLGFIH